MKFCKYCNCEHPITDEFWSTKSKAGYEYKQCKAKTAAKQKERRLKNLDKCREQERLSAKRRQPQRTAYHAEWIRNNPDKMTAINSRFYRRHKEQCNALVKEWHKENPGKHAEYGARWRNDPDNRGIIRNKSRVEDIRAWGRALPAWYPREKERIEEFYKNCPAGHEVDHIIPLRGKTISGLHCLANLQYLTISQNRQKARSWVGDV